MTKTVLVPDDHTLHEPEAIYLEPKCQGEKWGRTWAEENAWGECDCGLSHSSVKYIRADLAAPKPTIPEDDREEVALAIKHCFDTGKTRFDQITDAAIRTLISLGWTRHESFQSRVKPWMLECFGPVIPFDKTERNHRFLEEALELVQSLGCTPSEAHQLVDYVYNRPAGDPPQESGGVMVTHAALCIANNLDMMQNAETELARIWTKVELIRAKQAAKPKHSPLPGPTAPIQPPEGE